MYYNFRFKIQFDFHLWKLNKFELIIGLNFKNDLKWNIVMYYK